LFFSCAQDNMSEYGTLVINFSGGSSARSVTGKISPVFEDKLESEHISYKFECVSGGVVVTEAGPYEVAVPKDVQIQLTPGNWVVQVKVLQEVYQEGKLQGKEVIGSAQYKPFTIKAGQTVILGGISVPTSPYGVAIAHKAQPGFNYENINSWPNTSTINIDRYLMLDNNGYVLTGTSQPSSYTPDVPTAPHGTAKILWDKDALYVLVLVENAAGFAGGTEHNTDSVEIFFNEDDTGHQYRIDYAEKKTYGYYTSPGPYKKENSLPDNVSLSLIKDNLPNGVKYAVVAKLLFDDDRNNGDSIGIDLQINGVTANSNKRTSVAVWFDKTATAYNHPNLYKETLTLVE